MKHTTRLLLALAAVAAVGIFASCSKTGAPVNIVQHTDLTHVTGIAGFNGSIYCATKGGLVKWDIPESKYTVYTTIDGLASNILSDIAVDGDGLLWIGSAKGVTSFDGSYFTNYSLSDGLPSVEINDLAIDKNGKLWVATAEGVVSNEGRSFQFMSDEKGPGSRVCLSLFFDQGNNIWVGTEDDGIYSKSEDTWKRFSTKDGLIVNTIDVISQAWDRSFWVASWAGVSRFDGRGWQTFSSMKQLGTYEARDLASTEKRFWFFTVNGVHASQGTDWFHFTEDNGLISNDVNCGYVVSDDEVYVGTTDGMSLIRNSKTIENYFVPNSPVGYNTISIAVDDRDRVWLGTWETGLNMFDSGYWTKLIALEEKTLETVRSVVFAPDGRILFNTMGGLVFEKDNDWNVITRQNGISGDDVRCGLFDGEGRYWAGTASGICHEDGRGRWKRFRGIHGLPSEDTWACAMDSEGTLWFGTTAGIVSFKGDELTDRTREAGLGV
ncbi:MAG: hypothetical protein J7M24_07990, partial [Candidatus Latescibacteria bacterium]|nr:hypothetical protein [Candidatus Latescibacterota bacterium]